MRYYGRISRDRIIIFVVLAMSFVVLFNFGAVATFVAHEGTVLSEMQNRQAEAKLAALRHYVLGGGGDETADLRR